MLAVICGLSGPSGRHFCLECLTKLSDLVKGVPHAPVILEQYKEQGNPLVTKERTLEGISSKYREFMEKEGGKRSKASDYENCIHEPLNASKGTVLKNISQSPLHVSMGVGQHCVDIALKTALELDQEVRKDQGLFSDEVELLLSSLKEEISKGIELTDELDLVNSSVSSKQKRLLNSRKNIRNH